MVSAFDQSGAPKGIPSPRLVFLGTFWIGSSKVSTVLIYRSQTIKGLGIIFSIILYWDPPLVHLVIMKQSGFSRKKF